MALCQPGRHDVTVGIQTTIVDEISTLCTSYATKNNAYNFIEINYPLLINGLNISLSKKLLAHSLPFIHDDNHFEMKAMPYPSNKESQQDFIFRASQRYTVLSARPDVKIAECHSVAIDAIQFDKVY